MTSHLGVMILFAFCVAAIFGTLMKDEWNQQLRLGARIFSGLIVGAVAVGWLMYVIAP